MADIDPRTFAIGPGHVGQSARIVGFVAVAVALGFAARGWLDTLDARDDKTADDDYVCEDAEQGDCPSAIPVQLREDRFDDAQAIAPAEDELVDVEEPVEDAASAVSAGAIEDPVSADFAEAALPAAPADLPPTERTLSCVVGAHGGACLRWEQLDADDRALLEDLYRRNGVALH